MRSDLDHQRPTIHRRRHIALALTLGGSVLLGGCGSSQLKSSQLAPSGDQAGDAPHALTTSTLGGAPQDPATVSTSDSQQAPEPTGIRIPTIGVEASTVPLGLRPDGSIEVPTDLDQTGWWADGPEPGEPGPAVILGHVDSRSGPAVFFELAALQPGDVINVDRRDGSVVTYLVDRIEQHSKDAFPTEAVYGRTTDAVLRLVTCGGEFDRSERSYEDNIVVFANLAPNGG